MSHRHIATALAASILLSAMAPISSYAATSAPPADPSQSLAKIAAALGVTADEFNACFAGANPTPQGGKQSGPPQGQPQGDPGNGPGQQMKAELLSCLHNVNAKITADQLDQAMSNFGPIGPGGGPGGPGGGNGAPPRN